MTVGLADLVFQFAYYHEFSECVTQRRQVHLQSQNHNKLESSSKLLLSGIIIPFGGVYSSLKHKAQT